MRQGLASIAVMTALYSGVAHAQPSLGIGVLCSYSLVVGLQHFQSECRPGEAERANFLKPLIRHHRWYVTQNAAWDDADHDRFVAEQSQAASDCSRTDLHAMSDALLAEPERLTKSVELLLAKGRKPEWGACF